MFDASAALLLEVLPRLAIMSIDAAASTNAAWTVAAGWPRAMSLLAKRLAASMKSDLEEF